MNLDKNINDIVSIFNSFKENDDFYHELMKEAYSSGNYEEARKITRARDEFKNNLKISKDTTELIKTSFDKYIKIIETLNEKEKSNQNEFITSNNTYNVDLNSNEISNNDTFTFSTNNTNNNSENSTNNNDESNKSDSENSNQTDIVEPIEEVIDDSNYTFSSKIAKKNLEHELENINNQINIIRSNINNSEKIPSKKDYQQLFQLEAYRDRLNQRLQNINLEESYGNNDKVAARDKQLSDINQKINENKERLQSNKPKFVKVVIKKRLERLQNKQGTIKERQRSVVNKELLKYYKNSFKIAKSDSRDDAIKQYYQDKKDMLQEKKDAILDNMDSYNNSVITNLKNNFYKLRSLPTSARISYIEGLQNKAKNNEGILNGFRHLNKDIADKLYPTMQNKKQQMINQLRTLSGYLQNYSNTQQYNPGMEDLINNIAPTQPALEEVSSMHR